MRACGRAVADALSLPTVVQEGVSYRGYVNRYSYSYFVFTFYQANYDVVVSVTPFTGDPDVYITTCQAGQSGGCSEALSHRGAILPSRHCVLTRCDCVCVCVCVRVCIAGP